MEKVLDRKAIKGELVNFGYGKYPAAMNMAIDEVLFRVAAMEKRFFIRFYDFTRPSVILASSDSCSNFIGREGNGIDLTRRMTGGKPIYIDDNVLSYCVTGPIGSDNPGISTPNGIHSHFGGLIAEALSETIRGESIELGKAYSIRVNGKPIAGHGQHLIGNSAFMYHGVMAIGPWDANSISRNIKLRKEDIDELSLLPSIKGILKGSSPNWPYKAELMAKVLSNMRSDFEKSTDMPTEAREGMMKEAERLSKSVYGSASWVRREDIALKEDSRFCLLWEG